MAAPRSSGRTRACCRVRTEIPLLRYTLWGYGEGITGRAIGPRSRDISTCVFAILPECTCGAGAGQPVDAPAALRQIAQADARAAPSGTRPRGVDVTWQTSTGCAGARSVGVRLTLSLCALTSQLLAQLTHEALVILRSNRP